MKLTILVDPSLVIITMHLVYKSIEEDFKRKYAILRLDLYGHALAKNPYPKGQESTVLVIITIHLI